ncbi:hypothetical protein MUK42_10986 [Musa troglodytarum]|uniref:Uncharacterized protein n=1 Tax=Musa troglodytarum TaxID=320322 RepID=A0A9E7KE08_9LILI|nr:hypothetical protein MUK42_04390 [Musa troglodytarum]URE14001.1 hypothetical protein MUK42_10986 [Musa troglodytarum]
MYGTSARINLPGAVMRDSSESTTTLHHSERLVPPCPVQIKSNFSLPS